MTWVAPETAGSYEISVSVSDGEMDAQSAVTIAVIEAQQEQPTMADFRMVVAAPSSQQREALDEVFLTGPGQQLSPEELQALQAQGFVPSGVTDVSANIRVLMPDGIVVVMTRSPLSSTVF